MAHGCLGCRFCHKCHICWDYCEQSLRGNALVKAPYTWEEIVTPSWKERAEKAEAEKIQLQLELEVLQSKVRQQGLTLARMFRRSP